MSTLAIIDYGMGNLRSVAKAVELVGGNPVVTDDPRVVASADKLILPGVGAFKVGMQELRERGLVDVIRRRVRDGAPTLGICLGMHLLCSYGEEGGGADGLDLVRGVVKKFDIRDGAEPLKIPHMGWNQLQIAQRGRTAPCPLLRDVPDGSYMYFVHSYYVDPDDPSVTATTTSYGIGFPSMLWTDRLFAAQFHPEKSQTLGLRLLQHFVELPC